MLCLTLAFLVAQSSALALQPFRSTAAVRSAAAARSAAAIMADPEATRDEEDEAAPERKPWQLDGSGPKEAKKLSAEQIEQLVLPAESFKIEKLAMSQTDEDFVMECNLAKGETEAEMFLDIEPMFLEPAKYFYGFTANSDPKISIDASGSSEIEGEMKAKSHGDKKSTATLGSIKQESGSKRLTSIKLKFEPQFVECEVEAYLCFILPDETAFSRFYKITGKSIME